MSKQTNPIIKEDDEFAGKARRDKTEPPCTVKMRKGCYICGSNDIILQGVKFCTICGEEVEILESEQNLRLYRPFKGIKTKCGHTIAHKTRKRILYFSACRNYYIKKCGVCGAVLGPVCKNCGGNCWVKGNVKKCTKCKVSVEIGGN